MEYQSPPSFGDPESRAEAIQLFGELDVRRAERRGVDFYIHQIAAPKLQYVTFASALLQYRTRRQEDDPSAFQTWLHSLPEIFRGALIWWLLLPRFLLLIVHFQRSLGFWPFDQPMAR